MSSCSILQVRIGKCIIKQCESIEYNYLIRLQGQQDDHQQQTRTKTSSNQINFNTTLRTTISQQSINKSEKVMIRLYKIGDQEELIGQVKINVEQYYVQTWRFYQFNLKQGIQYIKQASVQLAVSFGDNTDVSTKSQIYYPNYDANQPISIKQPNLGQSRNSLGLDTYLQIDNCLMKQSKAVSNIQYFHHSDDFSRLRVTKKYIPLKKRTNTNFKRPQDLAQLPTTDIISHFQTQIQILQNALKQKQQWEAGMKELVQELEAENQLLKEITIQELAENRIQNYQQGIQIVSKLVHSKFQASRTVINANGSQKNSTKQLETGRFPQVQKQGSQIDEVGHLLRETKSLKSICLIQGSQNICIRNEQTQMLPLTSSSQQYLQQLAIIHPSIIQIQQKLFKINQQKQELQDMLQEMYNQLTKVKVQRDTYIEQIKIIDKQNQEFRKYTQSIKDQNNKLNKELQLYQKNNSHTQLCNKEQEINQLINNKKQLERQLKQAMKAIQQFKNDALSARQQIIVTEQQLNQYKVKYGELNTQINGSRRSSRNMAINKQKTAQLTIVGGQQNLQYHAIYSKLLEETISERQSLQTNLKKYFTNQSSGLLSQRQQLRRIQLKINKMFIQLLKNKSVLKNFQAIQKTKKEISSQVQSLLAC